MIDNRRWVLSALSVLVVVASVFLALEQPAIILLIPGLACAALFRLAWFRVTWFVLGAVVVFGTGDGLSAPKLIYLLGSLLAAVLAIRNVTRVLKTDWGRRFRPAVAGAVVMAAYLSVVTPVQSIVFSQIEPAWWLRDYLGFIFIPLGIIIAVDSISTFRSVKWARALALLVAAISAIGFAMYWIQSRGYVDATEDEVSRVVLVSSQLVALGAATAFALGLAGRRFKLLWVTLGFAFVGSVLVTGTRSGIALFTTILGSVGRRSRERIGPLKAVLVLGVGAMVLIFAVPAFASVISSQDQVEARFGGLVRLLDEGIGSDASGAARLQAIQYTWSTFLQNPLFGQGMGERFPDLVAAAGDGSLSLDTGLVYLAKWGLFGTLVVFCSLGAVIFSLLRSAEVPVLEQTIARSTLLTWTVMLALANVLANRGFAVGLALLIVLVGVAIYQNAEKSACSAQGTVGRSRAG